MGNGVTWCGTVNGKWCDMVWNCEWEMVCEDDLLLYVLLAVGRCTDYIGMISSADPQFEEEELHNAVIKKPIVRIHDGV